MAALEKASATDSMVPAADVAVFISDVKAIFGTHFPAAQGNTPESSAELYKELGELAMFINNAKKELQHVDTNQLTEKNLPDASIQLDAIVQMTEEATGKIMDECERVQATHQNVRDRLLDMDPPLEADGLAMVEDLLGEAETSVTHIYEACNFQDITGQRIQKVVKALQEIERQVLRMILVFGLERKKGQLDDDTEAELAQDMEMLTGPSLAGQGLEQDDIDDILQKLL